MTDQLMPVFEPIFTGDSTGLSKTDVVAALNMPLKWQRNTIWTAAFETAWRKIESDLISGPIRLDSESFSSMALHEAPPLPEGTLPAECSAVARHIDALNVGEIQSGLDAALAGCMLPPIPLRVDSLLAYAVLNACVPFKLPYLSFESPMTFYSNHHKTEQVRSFGVWAGLQRPALTAQPRLLYADYADERAVYAREFIVDLCADSNPCQVVVAAVAPKSTLAATLASVDQKIKKWRMPRFLEKDDVLQVPEVAFGINHEFRDLEGTNLLETRYDHACIDTAAEGIRFQLDRAGVGVASDANPAAAASTGASTGTHYLANRPFLVYARNRAAQHPFLVMWVGNAELIRRW